MFVFVCFDNIAVPANIHFSSKRIHIRQILPALISQGATVNRFKKTVRPQKNAIKPVRFSAPVPTSNAKL